MLKNRFLNNYTTKRKIICKYIEEGLGGIYNDKRLIKEIENIEKNYIQFIWDTLGFTGYQYDTNEKYVSKCIYKQNKVDVKEVLKFLSKSGCRLYPTEAKLLGLAKEKYKPVKDLSKRDRETLSMTIQLLESSKSSNFELNKIYSQYIVNPTEELGNKLNLELKESLKKFLTVKKCEDQLNPNIVTKKSILFGFIAYVDDEERFLEALESNLMSIYFEETLGFISKSNFNLFTNILNSCGTMQLMHSCVEMSKEETDGLALSISWYLLNTEYAIRRYGLTSPMNYYEKVFTFPEVVQSTPRLRYQGGIDDNVYVEVEATNGDGAVYCINKNDCSKVEEIKNSFRVTNFNENGELLVGKETLWVRLNGNTKPIDKCLFNLVKNNIF